MKRAVALRPATYLRRPVDADADEWIDAVARSRAHLEPYVYAVDSAPQFAAWLVGGERADTEQFLVCRRADDAIAGFVNLNNIVRGALCSTALGWGAFLPHAGRGHLRDGVEMACEMAFTQLSLHRVEANIQPGNARSRGLAVRNGFRLEGFSPSYLRIGEEWKDHERWALTVDDWRALRRAERRRADPSEAPLGSDADGVR